MEYDVFVCHASEDKDSVEPFAEALRDKGLSVWYDRFERVFLCGLCVLCGK
ncbi:MAG: toll/interleukin-1 receptor domain-containing protein [Phycisphaerae bacterium]|nr:toll/interleukin-1 receptor domain-containing protein [Phycisphaerae bacterium]